MMPKWLQVLNLCLSFVGALAWTPFVYDFLTPPKVVGKLLGLGYAHQLTHKSWDPKQNSWVEIKGLGYWPQIALCAINKNYNVEKVEVYAKYPNDSTTYKGNIIGFTFPVELPLSILGKEERRLLKIPPAEHVSRLVVLERGRMRLIFVPFIIDKQTYSNISELEFRIYDFDGNVQRVSFDMNKIDIKSMVVDETYFPKAP